MRLIRLGDGRFKRRLLGWRRGRWMVTADWMPPERYTLAGVSLGRDARCGDGGLSVTVGRFDVGLYWGARRGRQVRREAA
jgi:hypothetical protein